ncbi:MAG: HAD-IA family hydrolase [Geminicoccaceae bacterium]
MRLRAYGLSTAILFNGSTRMLADAVAAANLGPLLDAVISVDEIGVFKPAPQVYHLAAAKLGLSAGHIAFVSANGWDVHGAACFGFRSIWINRGGLPEERLPGRSVATIGSLQELPRLLQPVAEEEP